MALQLIQRLASNVVTTTWNNKCAPAENHDDDPKTLLGLLQRTARLWPDHGLAFKDKGWDQESSFMTYASLLKEAEVRLHALSGVSIN